jgi:hypothetical protein
MAGEVLVIISRIMATPAASLLTEGPSDRLRTFYLSFFGEKFATMQFYILNYTY